MPTALSPGRPAPSTTRSQAFLWGIITGAPQAFFWPFFLQRWWRFDPVADPGDLTNSVITTTAFFGLKPLDHWSGIAAFCASVLAVLLVGCGTYWRFRAVQALSVFLVILALVFVCVFPSQTDAVMDSRNATVMDSRNAIIMDARNANRPDPPESALRFLAPTLSSGGPTLHWYFSLIGVPANVAITLLLVSLDPRSKKARNRAPEEGATE